MNLSKSGQAGAKFLKLFGVPANRLSDSLVVSPFLAPRLLRPYLEEPVSFSGAVYRGVTGIFRGRKVSFIVTGMGHPLAADCLLCQPAGRRVIFLGSAGGIRGLSTGELILAEKAFFDFSYYRKLKLTSENIAAPAVWPDASMCRCCRKFLPKAKNATILSINSLWGQEKFPFLPDAVQAVDLECAAVYAAARVNGLPAAGLCFISDIPEENPFWRQRSREEKNIEKKNIQLLLESSLKIAVT